MKTPAVPPYLLPPSNSVVAGPWVSGDGVVVGEKFEHWDPFTDIELFREVDIDTDAVRSSCQLAGDSSLGLAASWFSNRTRVAGRAPTVELGTLGGRLRAPVSIRIPGQSSGGRIDIRIGLVLRSRGSRTSPISPSTQGAILWRDEARVLLEGTAARFPVSVIDFASSSRLPDAGAWSLEWDPDALETPVMGGLRLLVNSQNQSLLDALRSGSSDPRSSTIRLFVHYDVARSLVCQALASERFRAEPEAFESESIGRMLFELLNEVWPAIPVAALVARLNTEPGRLDAELQAYVGI